MSHLYNTYGCNTGSLEANKALVTIMTQVRISNNKKLSIIF